MLLVFRGLPGTGKSSLVQRLVRSRPDFLVLSRDSLRAGIVPCPTFTPDEKALVDDLIIAMAGFLLGRGRNVVIDGMALSSAVRVNELVHAAESHRTGVRIVECVCSEATALARIRQDKGSHPAGDRGEALYFDVKARFEPIAQPCLVVDTEKDPAHAIAEILDYISEAR